MKDRKCAASGAAFESLEQRMLLSVTFDFNYSLDTQGFFNAERRGVLETAGEMLSSRLNDDLLAIAPGGANTWTAKFTHPGTGEENYSIDDVYVAPDTIRVYAGGRQLGDVLGRGGAGGYSAAGSQDWLDRVKARGEAGALGPDAGQTDFGPWGGAITFDIDTNWHVSETTDGLAKNEYDFLTVALHELTHLLGFSEGVASFANLTSGMTFTGNEAGDEFDGAGSPTLASDLSHWSEGLTDSGQEALMDPTITIATRKLATRLDLAALDDIGWDINLSNDPGSGTVIMLSQLNGDGEMESQIATPGSSATFSFESIAAGRAFVQVVTPMGASLNAGVRVYDSLGLLIASDNDGHIGATADAEFLIDSGARDYTIQVVGLSSIGDFTLRVDTEPQTHFKYYPEGFANNQISEFVSITNPNDFEVTYSITLRYEDPTLPVEEAVVVLNETVGPGLRSGVTISDKGFRTPDLIHGGVIEKNTPYAIVVSSTGPLAASMSHFDFSIATGESFTDATSRQWSFARGERAPGDVNDFFVFFNPNDHDTRVTLTAMVPGVGPVSLTQVVEPMRRGGWGLNFEKDLPAGVYGITLTSEAADAANEDDHIGIVAALTHFDTVTGKGWGSLGDATAGSTFGVLPSMTRSEDGDFEIGFMNLTGAVNVVQIIGTYLDANLSDFSANVPVQPGSSFYITGSSLGVALDEPVGLTYKSITKAPLFVQGQDLSFADGTGTGASTMVGREFVFGDAFINPKKAGILYFETLNLYNPASTDLDVTIDVLFNDGKSVTVTTTVGAEDFGFLDLHATEAILEHAKQTPFFGMRVHADSPFAATFAHFDLFFGSGWEANGAPIGFTTSLGDIVA